MLGLDDLIVRPLIKYFYIIFTLLQNKQGFFILGIFNDNNEYIYM